LNYTRDSTDFTVFRQPRRPPGVSGTAIIALLRQATSRETLGKNPRKIRPFAFGGFIVLQVTINGDPRQFGRALAVTELLDELALSGKRVAIERNGEIVPRSRYAETRLANGDQLEIVVAVGGG